MHVIHLKEKHSTWIFIAKDDLEINEICLKILTERFNSGYWYGKLEPEPKMPPLMNVGQMTEYERELGRWEARNNFLIECQRAIETDNGALAKSLLFHRSRYEYEGIEIDEPDSIKSYGC